MQPHLLLSSTFPNDLEEPSSSSLSCVLAEEQTEKGKIEFYLSCRSSILQGQGTVDGGGSKRNLLGSSSALGGGATVHAETASMGEDGEKPS